mgnify:CR=1 FL=1
MEVVDVLIATDTVKLMSIALVIVGITVLLGMRLLGQAISAFRQGNDRWDKLISGMIDAVKAQTEATESLLELTETTSKSYTELSLKVDKVHANYDILIQLRTVIERAIQESAVVDQTIIAKLDALLERRHDR